MLKSQHFTTCPPDNPVTFAAKTSGFASKLPHKGLEVAKDGNEREKERDKDRDKERDKESRDGASMLIRVALQDVSDAAPASNAEVGGAARRRLALSRQDDAVADVGHLSTKGSEGTGSVSGNSVFGDRSVGSVSANRAVRLVLRCFLPNVRGDDKWDGAEGGEGRAKEGEADTINSISTSNNTSNNYNSEQGSLVGHAHLDSVKWRLAASFAALDAASSSSPRSWVAAVS